MSGKTYVSPTECSGKNYHYFFLRQNPPYFAIALHALNCICNVVQFTATIYYTYKIAPPNLLATMTTTFCAIDYVLGTQKSQHFMQANVTK